MLYTTLHYTTLHYIIIHYTTLHYTTLHHTTLHYTTHTHLECERSVDDELSIAASTEQTPLRVVLDALWVVCGV
jgi:hypothetical protein